MIKQKRLSNNLEKFAIENKISDNVAGPIKKVEEIIDDVYTQLNRKGEECIVYISKRKQGDYYYIVYGKLEAKK